MPATLLGAPPFPNDMVHVLLSVVRALLSLWKCVRIPGLESLRQSVRGQAAFPCSPRSCKNLTEVTVSSGQRSTQDKMLTLPHSAGPLFWLMVFYLGETGLQL